MQRGLEVVAGLSHSAALPSLSTYCVQGMQWKGLGAHRDVALSDRHTLGITTYVTAMVLGAQRVLCQWSAFPLGADRLPMPLPFPEFLCLLCCG